MRISLNVTQCPACGGDHDHVRLFKIEAPKIGDDVGGFVRCTQTNHKIMILRYREMNTELSDREKIENGIVDKKQW